MNKLVNTVIARSPEVATWQSRKSGIASPQRSSTLVSARNDKLYCVLLIAMYIIFLNPYFDVKGYNAHDPGTFIHRAMSIWKGVGYGEQFADIFLPVTGQPLGFSLLLAPLVGLVGVNFIFLKLFMLFFAGIFSIVLYQFFDYFLESKEQAVYATLIMMASPVIFGLSHRVLADIPLFTFVVLGLLALNRYLRTSGQIFSRWLIVASFSSSAAYLLKQTGLAVFFGGWFLFLHPDFRNKEVFKKLLIYSFLGFIPITLWQIWCSTIPQDLWYWTMSGAHDYLWKNPFTPKDGYLSFSEFVVRVRHNLVWGISNNMAMVFLAPLYFVEGNLLGFLVGLPLVFWFAWQWGKSFMKRPSVLEGFVFLSLAILVPKYLGMAARYVAIIWPALLVYGIRAITPFPNKFQGYLLNSVVIVSLCTTLAVSIEQWQNPYGSKTLADYVAVASQAKKLFSEGDVCKAPLPTHWQVLTGHQCQYDGRNLVTYFVSLSDPAPQNLDPYKDVERDALEGAKNVGMLWKNQKSEFKKVFQNNTFALFKVVNHGD